MEIEEFKNCMYINIFPYSFERYFSDIYYAACFLDFGVVGNIKFFQLLITTQVVILM